MVETIRMVDPPMLSYRR